VPEGAAAMRIIAIKTHAAGDLLLTTPALRAIRKGFPRAELILVTGHANVGITAALPGFEAYLLVDEVGLFGRRLGAIYTFFKSIKLLKAYKIILFQPAPALARLAALAGAPVYAPYATPKKPPYLADGVPWRPNTDKYIAENYVEVAEAAGGVRDGLHLDFVIPEHVPPASDFTGGTGKKKYVAVAPGGGVNPREAVEAKLPPVKFFSDVVDFVNEETGRAAVLVGGPGDVARCGAVAAACRRPPVNLAGKTTPLETGRVLEAAAYVITTDSLPLHIAVALDKPGIAFFGPTNPNALLPRESTITPIRAQVDCAPCYANAPFPPCKRPYKYECRDRFPLELVKSWISDKEKK